MAGVKVLLLLAYLLGYIMCCAPPSYLLQCRQLPHVNATTPNCKPSPRGATGAIAALLSMSLHWGGFPFALQVAKSTAQGHSQHVSSFIFMVKIHVHAIGISSIFQQVRI
jgi:hypothetical protein